MASFTVKFQFNLQLDDPFIQSHQGLEASDANDEVTIVTTTKKVLDVTVDVAASAIATLWLATETHGLDRPQILWVLPYVDGVLEWVSADAANADDVNTISVRAGFAFVLAADQTSGKIRSYSDFATTGVIDALGNGSSVLEDIVKLRFKSLNTENAGRVRVIGFK